MSMTSIAVSSLGNEAAFISKFINTITAFDSRIVCTDRNINASSGVFYFDLTFWDTVILRFDRNDTSNVNGWYVSEVGSNPRLTPFHLGFSTDYHYWDDTEPYQRSWQMRICADSKALYVAFADHDGNLDEAYIQCMIVRQGEIAASAFGDAQNPTAIQGTFQLSDSTAAHKVDRLPYAYADNNPAYIQKIGEKVFCTGDDQAAVYLFACDKLLDTSKISRNNTVVLDGNTYFALDEHTLMEV